MENVKQNISKNLIMLRKNKKMTQKDVAKEFNYSDKAVSRWEIGESMPDIDILLKICDFYGVDFDWLIHSHEDVPQPKKSIKSQIRIAIALLFVVSCYTLATIIFVYNILINKSGTWKVFVFATSIALIISIFCSKKWWSRTCTFVLSSLCIWSLLGSIFVALLPQTMAWPIFLLGIPLQTIIVLIFIITKDKTQK